MPTGTCSNGDGRPAVARGLCRPCWRSIRLREKRPPRSCAHCAGPIPVERNARAKFCSLQCKTAAHNAKKAGDPRHQERMRWYLRLHKLGVTQADYETLFVWQGGRCAICFTDEPRGRGDFHIDHDHETGRVRGLLCSSCNLILGHVQDDPDLLEAAATYLRT